MKTTISLDEQVKRMLSAFARRNKKTMSGFISDRVKKKRIHEPIAVTGAGLGTRLLSSQPILAKEKESKKTLAKLREEKRLR